MSCSRVVGVVLRYARCHQGSNRAVYLQFQSTRTDNKVKLKSSQLINVFQLPALAAQVMGVYKQFFNECNRNHSDLTNELSNMLLKRLGLRDLLSCHQVQNEFLKLGLFFIPNNPAL